MKYSTAISMAVAAVGVQSQGIPAGSLVPSEPAPAGCLTTAPGRYEVTVVKPSTAAKRSLEKRVACGADSNALIFTLQDGILHDSKGRVGAIVHNRQFQFDGPPAQTGSIYTGGFSICPNSSLAIGGSTEFYQCLSGGFYNLYDQNVAAQCSPVRLNTLKCDDASPSAPGTPASQASDGQPQASSATSVVNQQSDGQPTAAPATAVISQISDGQIQGPTTPAGPVVSQISDGQIQATSASNATITSAQPTAPIATGGAASVVGSGAVVGAVAIAAFFL